MTNIWTGHDYKCTMLKIDLERLSVTLTFELETRVLGATHLHSLLYICAKLFKNLSINEKGIERSWVRVDKNLL